MESSFDTNDFERSLKEHADKFFLVPSERVWTSIYNDLRPGSKWPSLAVGLILLVSLFWIGNTHKETLSDNSAPINAVDQVEVTGAMGSSPVQYAAEKNTRSGTSTPEIRRTERKSEEVPGSIIPTKPVNKIDQDNAQVQFANRLFNAVPGYTLGILATDPKKVLALNSNIEIRTDKSLKRSNTLSNVGLADLSQADSKLVVTSHKEETANVASTKQLSGTVGAGNVAAVTNKKNKKRSSSWTFFVAPERSNVIFTGTNLNKNSTSGIVTSPYSQHNMTTAGRYGFQLGSDVAYKLTKTIDLTSGFHLNYSGYDIMTELVHPSPASVSYRNAEGEIFTKNYISMYGNNRNGSLKITNYNMQFAIPVGLQWTLFEQDNIKVSVVSTVEPFLVLGSKAYVLSGDGKRFVNDPDLMRTVNLNGNFGSVITFSSHKVDWNIGPSIRYQVLSTYHNIYPVREHLFNYGIRIGISKPD